MRLDENGRLAGRVLVSLMAYPAAASMVRFTLLIIAGSVSCLAASELIGTWVGSWQSNGKSDGICLSLSEDGGSVQGYLAYHNDATYVEVNARSSTDNSAAFEFADKARGAVRLNVALTGEILAGTATAGGRSEPLTLRKYIPPSSYFRYGGVPATPVLVYSAPPEYTSQARAAKIQGKVILFVTIQASGAVGNEISVLHSLGFGLDEKAIECAQKWKFSPPRLDCKPVRTHARIQVEFHL